jgi:hypothetical protein
MSSLATYGPMYLPGKNDISKIKADDTGYYKMVLGGFNMPNGHGIFYLFTDSVKKLFEPGGIVRRRLDSGLCRSEYGHPDLSGLTFEERLARLARTDPDRVCNHIREISLEEAKDENGKSIILALGHIKPSGPFGDVVEKQLTNPCENVAYSIRSFATGTTFHGKQARIVTDAITYDYVPEPGISTATQFYTATLESMDSLGFTFDEIMLDKAILINNQCGLESDTSALRMVKSSLGWKQMPVNDISILNAKW